MNFTGGEQKEASLTPIPVSVESFQTVMKKTVCAIVILWLIGFLCPGTALTEEPAKTDITVMSYNIYRGGTMLGQPLSQTVKVIQEAKADIVGIQEARSPSGVNAQKLAELLGWNHYEDRGNRVIITRYEIVEEMKDGIKVRLPSGQEAYLFNLHLPSHPYQPYQLLEIRPKWHKHTNNIEFIKTEAEAIEWAQKARGAAITALLEQINKLPDQDAPVFVVGDFNEPSHLDWTKEAAASGRHPIKVAYPTSKKMAQAGFADAWRTLYPDELEQPGYTWSPAYPFDDPTTHPDRIDFVYFRGKGVSLKQAKIVGENKENADLVVSPYPSDHRAVVAAFKLPDQPTANPAADQAAFEKAEADTAWAKVFSDSGTWDWQEQWFLDGEVGTVTNSPEGMTLTAGPEFKNDAHHMVLWTKDSFSGDLKIKYDYTRLDEAPNCVTILYLQATGSGKGPYAKDITKWSDLRKVPAMKMYFNNMNTYHISYAAFPESKKAYLRGRRYLPENVGLNGTELKPDYSTPTLFATGVKHRITVIKKDRDLHVRVENPDEFVYFHMNNPDLPAITQGRIGLRHMFTRSARYTNFRVWQPRSGKVR